ncbi:MAG: redox-regulated ATPase YchF [Pseudomonadota bacterium]
MKIGLFGFPKVGKTTLFNTLTGSSAGTEAYSGGRGKTHLAVANVPDHRLSRLSEIFKPEKTTPAKVEYLDVVGVEKGEAKESETFLGDIRGTDALLHVVRAFGDAALPHSQGSIDPRRDADAMETELILADHLVVEGRIERLEANLKKGAHPEDEKELGLLRKCSECLDRAVPLRDLEVSQEESRKLRGFTFLSAKPLLIALNLSESDVGRIATAVKDFGLERFTSRPSVGVVPVSAKIEMEIAQLGNEDRAEFLKSLNLEEPCLDRLIRMSYGLLGLISFFTVGEDECRAWTIQRGTNAHKAAGAIHSDLERGFIRAEVIAYDELLRAGSWNGAKEKGKLRLEGKEYVVQDGDIAHIRFNT